MREYKICTLVTDIAQYNSMKSSFLSAGFDDARCSYSIFDNTAGNQWDPYAVINKVLAEAEGEAEAERPRYLIFCHQDVILDQGHGIEELSCALNALEKIDAKWAVAGNGGATRSLKIVRHLADPIEVSFTESLPARVLTLDENLLIVKTGVGLRCSAEMTGFHLYGTDLCLEAFVRGYSAYVVDFKLTHLSSGNLDEKFYGALQKLQMVWDKRFVGAFVASPCITFVLSRFAPVRRVLKSGRVYRFVQAHPRLNSLMVAFNQPFFRRLRA